MKMILLRSYKVDSNFLKRRLFAKYILSSCSMAFFATSRNSYGDNININYTGTQSYEPLVMHFNPPPPLPNQAEIDRLNVNVKHLLVDVYLDNLILDKTELQSDEPASGRLTIINNSQTKKDGDLKLSLMNEFDIDDLSTENSRISLESNTINEISFKDGPKLRAASNNIDAKFLAQSKLTGIESKLIILSA